MAASSRSSRPGPIVGSIIFALMLTLAPLPGWAEPYRPEPPQRPAEQPTPIPGPES